MDNGVVHYWQKSSRPTVSDNNFVLLAISMLTNEKNTCLLVELL